MVDTGERHASMTGRILVCGATGQVGRRVFEQLGEHGVPRRGMSRAAPASDEWVRADFEDPASLPAALDGVDRVFLACGDRPAQDRLEGALIEACRTAGIEHVVKLSAQSAGLSPPVSFGRLHRRTEQVLAAAVPGATVLRPVFFMQSLAFFADDIRKGRLIAPTGAGRVALVDADDVADVAVQALLHPDRHRGAVHTLTGPRAWSFSEIVAEIGEAAGRRIRHISPPAMLARLVLPFVSGMPRWQSNLAVELMAAIARGAQADVSDTISEICGRPPGTLPAWLAAHAESFTAPPPDR